jgi:sugar fermentation stimulation protein A
VRFTGPLRDATFTKRINRFLASILIDGKEQFAHVPNSGRMGELLTTGRGIKLREGKSRARKTRFDVSLVDFNGSWVSIDARLPGVLLAESIEESDIADFNGYFPLKREITYRSSRFDLLLGKGRSRCLVETKAVTLVRGELALFPDAPTARGTRHVLDLTEAMEEGYEAWLVFVCQRGDARFLSPNISADLRFAEALKRGYGLGLKVLAFNCEVNETEVALKNRIPVIL